MKNKNKLSLSFYFLFILSFFLTPSFSQSCSGTRIPAGNYGALNYGIGNYYIAAGDTVTVAVISFNGAANLCNSGTLKVSSSMRISNGSLTNYGCIAVRGTLTVGGMLSTISNGSSTNSAASITSTGMISCARIDNYGIIQTIRGADLVAQGNITNQTTGVLTISGKINILNGNLANYNCIYSFLFISVNGAGNGNIINGLPASASIGALTTITASGVITNFGNINPNCQPINSPCSATVTTSCNAWLFQ